MIDHPLSPMRHTLSHIMMQALIRLYPDAIPAVGPAIEDGFYHDFDSKHRVTEEDLPKIEAEMRKIIKEKLDIVRTVMPIEEARAFLQKKGYKYAIDFLDDVSEGGGKEVSFYQQGEFINMCSGPHVKNTGKVVGGGFKLIKIAGAYHRGDSNQPMLQRIYGVSFSSKDELDTYLNMIEEAKKRDHKKIGKELDLFIISPEVGAGFPLYMPRGMALRRNLEKWLNAEKEKRGYQFVWTPHVAKSDLYKKSGHWQKYDAMYNPMKIDEDEYVVKPMNCPHHFQIFNARMRSYRELPLRLAENGTVYRYEKAGELNGLLRVRSLTQDDTHMFIRHSQIPQEIDGVLDLAFHVYEVFGFKEFRARISARDPKKPEQYLGSPAVWDKAEAALIDAVKRRGVKYFVGEGEAAFYGPKIDVMVKDALGREWQLTTVQLDFNQPENFDMNYTNEEGKPERPAVLHVAILGTFDRFLAILIEHFGGAFPLWLSPIQIQFVPVSEDFVAYTQEVAKQFEALGFRVFVDDRNESVGKKIRLAVEQKVPYMAVIGEKEKEAQTLAIRKRGEQKASDFTTDKFIKHLQKEMAALK